MPVIVNQTSAKCLSVLPVNVLNIDPCRFPRSLAGKYSWRSSAIKSLNASGRCAFGLRPKMTD